VILLTGLSEELFHIFIQSSIQSKAIAFPVVQFQSTICGQSHEVQQFTAVPEL
jgi:hypothetical protein